MAKVILKWRYLKPGAKAHNENLVKYIAKREGVEKIDDSWKAEPVSKAQQKMIDELLQEFPESKDSYEYQDFLRQPNKGNASEFITRTIEENLDQVDKRENYVQYIAKRPRVEKVGTHGLFTDDNVPVHLNEVAEEVASHQGVLMTQILSLRREDAARLGYEKGEAWRTLIRNHTKDMAEAMNIPMEDAKLVGCNMNGMVAEEADFCGTTFVDCKMRNCIFTHSNFAHTSFQDADLWMSDFTFCCIENANIKEMDTDGVKLIEVCDDEAYWLGESTMRINDVGGM